MGGTRRCGGGKINEKREEMVVVGDEIGGGRRWEWADEMRG